MIMLALVNGWNFRHLDYVLAFAQSPCDSDLYVKIPTGVHVKSSDNEEYFLNLIKNVDSTK